MSNLNKFNEDTDSKLKDLFGDLPPESDTLVNLPSEGRFYPENSNPQVIISPIKFEDEKDIVSNLRNKVNPVNLLLSKCVKGLDSQRLLLIDKMFLLLKIRAISYGEIYPASIVCPKCSTESKIEINLNQLIVNPIPSDVTDPREVTLPKVKKTAKVRFPRISDEAYLTSQEEIYSNLWRFVIELNGSNDPVFIAKAIPKLPIMDIKKLVKEILRDDLGLNPKILFECGHCKTITKIEVPVNENFFSVT